MDHSEAGRPELRLWREQDRQTQNVEPVLHILSTVQIALLIEMLTT